MNRLHSGDPVTHFNQKYSHMPYLPVTSMFYHGSKPLNPSPGSLYLDNETSSYYMYDGQNWVEYITSLSDNNNHNYRVTKSPLLKDGICSCCGASDNGSFKCRYCKTTLRYYE